MLLYSMRAVERTELGFLGVSLGNDSEIEAPQPDERMQCQLSFGSASPPVTNTPRTTGDAVHNAPCGTLVLASRSSPATIP